MDATLEEVAAMAEKLTPSDKIKLVKRLAISLENSQLGRKKPQSLRGSWKGKFPEDVDIEKVIREIRDEWKKELDEFYE